jgi:hypothetical protein
LIVFQTIKRFGALKRAAIRGDLIREAYELEMSRGGARLGAGRKPGIATKRVREVEAIVAKEGHKLTPLAYLLNAINDERVPETRRDQLAIAALPFCSPKLAAVVMQHSNVEPIHEVVWRILPPQSSSLIEHEPSDVEEG